MLQRGCWMIHLSIPNHSQNIVVTNCFTILSSIHWNECYSSFKGSNSSLYYMRYKRHNSFFDAGRGYRHIKRKRGGLCSEQTPSICVLLNTSLKSLSSRVAADSGRVLFLLKLTKKSCSFIFNLRKWWAKFARLKRTIWNFHCTFWPAQVKFRKHVPEAKMCPRLISNSGKINQKTASQNL